MVRSFLCPCLIKHLISLVLCFLCQVVLITYASSVIVVVVFLFWCGLLIKCVNCGVAAILKYTMIVGVCGNRSLHMCIAADSSFYFAGTASDDATLRAGHQNIDHRTNEGTGKAD